MTHRIPYDLAHKICLERCYSIRHYLTPLFGPNFVNECTYINSDEQEHTKRRPGRKPRSPTFAVKRKSEDLIENDERYPPRENDLLPNKRRALSPCASGTVSPPELPSNLNIDKSLTNSENCQILRTARELTRMKRCPFEGTPKNDWPMPGDPRMGGHFNCNGRRYRWNGDNQLTDESLPRKTLPSIKDIVQPIPYQQKYTRFPITPSPHQSPRQVSSIDWPQVPPIKIGGPLASPPMSSPGSINGYSRERQHSIITTDEFQEVYSGSLFSSPQPE